MKYAHSALSITAALALLAVSAAFAANTSADKAAKPDLASPPLINYSFDSTPLDRSNSSRLTSYADMLDKVTPGVVGVYPSRKVLEPGAIRNDPMAAARQFGRYAQIPQNENEKPDWTDSAGVGYVTMGVGSGCIISADGYILTNHHVVAAADSREGPVDGLLVKLSDGREFPAKLIGSDQDTDIALIKIDAKNLPTLKMADSEKARVGDIVFAVGNPMDVGLTVTSGIVSAIGRTDLGLNEGKSGPGLEDFIQTDASINPGNSGGPLVDAEGRLVGLNSVIFSASRQGGSIGIGFAIPSALARHVADNLIKDGKVHRGALGVYLGDIDSNLAESFGLPNTHGALIEDVVTAKPAAQAGIQAGDVVVKLNDQDIDTTGKLRYLVAMTEPGKTVNLTVLRAVNGQAQSKVFKVEVADSEAVTPPQSANAQAMPPAPMPTRRGRFNNGNNNNGDILNGVTMTPLTADLSQGQKLAVDTKGLIVTGVTPNSPFVYEFPIGTVILEVNGKPVSTVEELRAQIQPGKVNRFYVYILDQNGAGHKAYVTETIPAAP